MKKIIFLGTPEFALPSLKALFDSGFDIPFIITQADKPVGRGQKIIINPVKQFAQNNNIPVYQPIKLKDDIDLIEKLKLIKPDLMITAAFGQIISEEIIQIPKYGIWNVHASLLPRWRGAAPINWSILAGDEQTGITIMQTEKGLDTGPILSQRALFIEKQDNIQTLTQKLASLGAELLISTIKENPSSQPQNDLLAVYAPKLNKNLGLIDWELMTAKNICQRIKALSPWPSVFFQTPEGDYIKIIQAECIDSESIFDIPHIIENKNKLLIACCQGILEIQIIQAPNKNKVQASDWLRGLRKDISNIIQFKNPSLNKIN